jgi:hypothetical protein
VEFREPIGPDAIWLLHAHPPDMERPPAPLVVGEFRSRLWTTALPFGVSPWTCGSTSPTVRWEGIELRPMRAATDGVLTPRSRMGRLWDGDSMGRGCGGSGGSGGDHTRRRRALIPTD